MKHYEEVLKILHDKFDWKLTDSLTTTGKKLVADTIKALKIAENNQNLQLQQTGVSTCFSDSVIRQAKKLYEKYLSVCAYQLNKVPDENIKNLAKQLAFMEIQEYRFNRWFSNRKYWLEVENALYKLFPIK